MRLPSVGDEYTGRRRPGTLGRSVTWRVAKILKKADSDYVELQPVNEQLERKILSARALNDSRLFLRVEKE